MASISVVSAFRRSLALRSSPSSSLLLPRSSFFSSQSAQARTHNSHRNPRHHMSKTVTFDQPTRVRFAPSPTGSLHVGGARTAMFNWLLARKTHGTFLVRVEDTDEERSTRASETSILNDLKWLGLHWDEGPEVGGPYGPYRQSERKDIYKAAAEELIRQGKAYRCFCSEEELEQKRLAAEAAGVDPKYDGKWRDADPAEVQRMLDAGVPYTVRFRVPAGKIVSIDDVVRGTVTWDADATLGDFIILRSNGMPVYNFCVAVDDAQMKITHVIRAEEHLTNTLRQVLVLEALNYTHPVYAHCSLILGADRSKLSKRHGATSVQQFSEQGFLPAAMLNYLANLGWNDGTNKEIYSPDELVQAFDMNRIIKSSAVFDMNKLVWINSQHLRALPFSEVQPIVKERLTRSADAICVDLDELSKDEKEAQTVERFLAIATKIAQRDMDLATDACRLVGNCLRFPIEETLQSDPSCADLLQDSLLNVIKVLLEDFDVQRIPTGEEEIFDTLWKDYMKSLGQRLGLKGKHLFHPVRFLLTGRMSGPDVGDQIKIMLLAKRCMRPDFQVRTMADRMEYLRNFSLDNARLLSEKATAIENE